MFIRRSTTVKYFIAAFLGAAIYCEWFIYLVQPQYWTDLDCSEHDSTCTKILFIADPQIQGEYAVSPPLSYLINWDSDRYLKSTFKVVVKYFKPDVLVFLGDLMDEGSISSIVQFHSYVKRLANIFEVDHQVLQVWVQGDNDIGGENEPIRHDKIAEFEKVFQQPSIIYYRNVSFYKVNAITNTHPQKSDTDEAHENNFKIVVSHYPVTLRHMFGLQVYNAIRPNIFFCAHEHESKYVKETKELKDRKVTWFENPKSTLSLAFNDESLYEVYVPTCSYRMGTSYIGYGAAVLGIGCLYVIFFGFLNFLIIKIVLIFIYCFNRYYNLLHFIYSILFILCNKYKAVRWTSNKQKYTSFDFGTVKTIKRYKMETYFKLFS
ncbi:unnamed protein product [Arctia plantaginis]|uniref:Calcineurin-like phosphoesterase domain-containing protein n=1 Tax=Arctia plantaginis TaxID=874455 RepID=A0A8S0ZX84_ARCPL|nr:unnamed protein product [Arctia plantaginis]